MYSRGAGGTIKEHVHIGFCVSQSSTMDQTVNIPFSIRLDAGDTTFNIDVDKKFTTNPNRLFGFSSVTLTPDYYSRQAFKLDLDSEEELKASIVHNYYLEVEFQNSVFDLVPYTPSATPLAFNNVLKTINTHYETNFAAEINFPTVVFDWVHVRALGKTNAADLTEFYLDNHQLFYGTAHDESNPPESVVPEDFETANPIINKWPFPTNKDVLKDIRVRMTLAPNTTIAFSNTILPTAMGVAESQYTIITKQQYRIQNHNKSSFKSFIFQKAPKFEDIAYATKIHTYPTAKNIISDRGTLTTTKERERKPNLLVKDYNSSISALAKRMNLNFSLEHEEVDKKFRLVFPDSTSGIKINMRVAPYVANLLGYGHVNYITADMTNKSYPDPDIQINNVEAISKVLVYDTGMVVVSLDQQASQQTHQFTNTVMAILESDDAGVMTTRPGMEFARVPVSHFNPNLEFVLSRFNETNEPMPLGWKVGAYIRGVLVGKV